MCGHRSILSFFFEFTYLHIYLPSKRIIIFFFFVFFANGEKFHFFFLGLTNKLIQQMNSMFIAGKKLVHFSLLFFFVENFYVRSTAPRGKRVIWRSFRIEFVHVLFVHIDLRAHIISVKSQR